MPTWSNSLWQGWSCGLVHCPGGNATDPIWRVLVSSDGISSLTPLKHSIPCWLSVQWEPSACRSRQCCQKKGSSKFMGEFALSGLLGSGRASMFPLGTPSLGLWVIAIDPAFIAGHQSIKNCGIWIDQLDYLPAVMKTSFFLIFSEHPWDKIFCIFSSSRIIVCIVPTLTSNCAPNISIDIRRSLSMKFLYLANQLWCIDFLTPPTPLIIPHILSPFLGSLMPLKNWCSIHTRCSKSSLKHSIRFCGIFPSLKQNFIAYGSSKVSSRPDCIFEIHQLWQSGFSRVYSNSCCSCPFEREIIKIGQSSHKMHSTNILNFQESTPILNACTKKSENLLKAPRKYMLCRVEFMAWRLRRPKIRNADGIKYFSRRHRRRIDLCVPPHLK